MIRKNKKRKGFKHLSADQLRFNREAVKRKGKLNSVNTKRYIFGHATNVKKGRV
jgi:hypothetical protein